MENDSSHDSQATALDSGPESRASVLILFAHPALEKSRVNRQLVEEVRDLPGVTFHDLYESYPDFHIRVDREQELLEQHQIVVMQHPLFWYSTPALLKEWQDLVLVHGWAYGSEGRALAGKTMCSAVTTGGREQAYTPEGFNRFSLRELLRPIEQTAWLCGIDYLGPFAIQGTLRMDATTIGSHVRDYRRFVEALRDGQIDLEAARQAPRLNTDLDTILRGSTQTAAKAHDEEAGDAR